MVRILICVPAGGIVGAPRGLQSAMGWIIWLVLSSALSRYRFVMASIALCVCPLTSQAQMIDVYSNYQERIGSRLTTSQLSTDEAFGARANIATGALSFSVPVLSIPGNNGLDLSVTYKLGLRDVGGHTEWTFEEDEPYLSGTFSDSAGWTTQFGGAQRCSNVTIAGSGPPNVPSSNGRPGTFYTAEYWSGYFLSLPNGGGRLNKFSQGSSSPDAPTIGGPYKWATNELWYFSCTPLMVGAGEGFVGHSPDGLKYFFNAMRDGPFIPALGKLNAQGQEIDLDRREIRIYATRVEDRFGNYVAGLSASDGRSIVKTESGSTTTYSYAGRQWVVNRSMPFSVTYPDGSVWSASTNGLISDYVSLKLSCPGDSRTLSPSTTTATIKSPAGATATYTLKQILLGYSYVSGQCIPLDSGGSATDRPSVLIAPALVRRVVSGPGLQTEILDIDYGPSSDCYSNTLYWSPKCVASSPTSRTVTHSYSDGRYRRYIFGNRDLQNADLLQKLEEGMASGAPERVTEYTYQLMPSVGSFVGASLPYSVESYRRSVLIERRIKQDGSVFIWSVPSTCGDGTSLCVDQYARPIKVIRTRSPAG